MLFNGIEYKVRLYITDAYTDEDITEEVFDNLDQMADYIEKTYEDERFVDAKGEYTFVEVVDGVPGTVGKYFYEVFPYYPLDEEDLEETLRDFTVDVPKLEEMQKKEWEKELAFHPSDEKHTAGDASKDIPLSEYSYICPNCFNEVETCTCRHYPYNLVQIDKLMVPIIKELNCKGYLTMYSCAGHPDYKPNPAGSFIFITFKENYEFPAQFPEGAIYRKSDHSLSYDCPSGSTIDSLKQYQQNYLDALMEWARSL